MWRTIRIITGVGALLVLSGAIIALLTESYDVQYTVLAAVLAGLCLVLVVLFELSETRHMSQIYRDVPEEEPESPTNRSFPAAPKQDDPGVVIHVTHQKMDDAEEFMDKVKNRVEKTNGNGHFSINVDVVDDDES